MSPFTALKVGAALIAAFFAVEAVRTRVAAPEVRGPTLAQQVQSQSPEQTPATEAAFAFKGFTLRPLARLTVQARVLRREDYYLGTKRPTCRPWTWPWAGSAWPTRRCSSA